MDFTRYRKDFDRAIAISNDRGFDVDARDSRFLGTEETVKIWVGVKAGIDRLGFKQYSTSCSAIHMMHRKFLQAEDPEFAPLLTIGWVEFNGETFFETTQRELLREIKEQRKRRSGGGSFDHHVWLTFLDGDKIQILDCTIGYYLYRHGKSPDADIFRFDTSNDPGFHQAIEYYPLLAGQNALDALALEDEATW